LSRWRRPMKVLAKKRTKREPRVITSSATMLLPPPAPDEAANAEVAHRVEDVTRRVGAEIFGRVAVDTNAEEHGFDAAFEGPSDVVRDETIALDDRHTRAHVGGELVGCACEHGEVVPGFEGLGDALRAERASGAEDGELQWARSIASGSSRFARSSRRGG